MTMATALHETGTGVIASFGVGGVASAEAAKRSTPDRVSGSERLSTSPYDFTTSDVTEDGSVTRFRHETKPVGSAKVGGITSFRRTSSQRV
jgi:hypothetical protein